MKIEFMRRSILFEIIFSSTFTRLWWSTFCINCSKKWLCIFWSEFNFFWRRKCRSNENAENKRFEWLIYLILINWTLDCEKFLFSSIWRSFRNFLRSSSERKKSKKSSFVRSFRSSLRWWSKNDFMRWILLELW